MLDVSTDIENKSSVAALTKAAQQENNGNPKKSCELEGNAGLDGEGKCVTPGTTGHILGSVNTDAVGKVCVGH